MDVGEKELAWEKGKRTEQKLEISKKLKGKKKAYLNSWEFSGLKQYLLFVRYTAGHKTLKGNIVLFNLFEVRKGFPGGSDSIASACNVGDLGSMPGLGRSGERNGDPLQYSGLENSMDCTVHPSESLMKAMHSPPT